MFDSSEYVNIHCSLCGWKGKSDTGMCEGCDSEEEEDHEGQEQCYHCDEWFEEGRGECSHCHETTRIQTLYRCTVQRARKAYPKEGINPGDKYKRQVWGGYDVGAGRWLQVQRKLVQRKGV